MVTDDERREVAWMPDGIDPIPGVPEVRVLDEDGKEVMRGYYYRHVKRQVAPLGADLLRPEDVEHCVVHDGFADWNMPKPVKVVKITPPHRIEVLGGIDRDALLAQADELDMCADGCRRSDRASLTAEEVWECARRIREACGEVGR